MAKHTIIIVRVIFNYKRGDRNIIILVNDYQTKCYYLLKIEVDRSLMTFFLILTITYIIY